MMVEICGNVGPQQGIKVFTCKFKNLLKNNRVLISNIDMQTFPGMQREIFLVKNNRAIISRIDMKTSLDPTNSTLSKPNLQGDIFKNLYPNNSRAIISLINMQVSADIVQIQFVQFRDPRGRWGHNRRSSFLHRNTVHVCRKLIKESFFFQE